MTVAYFIYKFLVWFWQLLLSVNWHLVYDYIMYGIAVAAVVAMFFGSIYLVLRFLVFLACKYGSYCIPCEKRREAIKKVLSYPFIVIWSGLKWVGSGLVTLYNVIMVLKDNNCPGIEWKD